MGHLDAGVVQAALAGFLGDQRQRPPRYSAKHVAGERSYRLARRGKGVDPAEVPVTVYQAELVGCALPEVTFRVTVSPGTYVRAIARDLGERLGVGAHLTALRREAIGGLGVSDAVPLDRPDARRAAPGPHGAAAPAGDRAGRGLAPRGEPRAGGPVGRRP